jgi:lipopolysaccharide/colanic/teichoic acid biosynthesis glycosyltransferase
MTERSFASGDARLGVLTAPSAQRAIQLAAIRVAPGLAGAGITYAHLQSEWQALIVFICMSGAIGFLLGPRYPLHLMPVAAVCLYFAGPLLGGLAAYAISGMTDSIQPLTWREFAASVLGAWVVVGIGWWITRRLRQDREMRLAVIGTAEFASGLEEELKVDKVQGYSVIGSITPDRRAWPRGPTADARTLGSISRLRELVLEHRIDLLVLGPLAPAASPRTLAHFQAFGPSRPEVFELTARACLDLPVSMIDASQFYEHHFGHVPLGTMNASWLQYVLHPDHREKWPMSKRLFDLVLGTLAGVIALPIVAVAGLAIKLSDRGPVLYRQRRVGESGAEYEMLKLRTMAVDADQRRAAGATEEELISGVGRMLRRLHVNELPQLWHVLKGQMSLVGPRPEVAKVVSSLEAQFPYYDRRHLMKPGVTGWASVRCGYSGTPLGEAWKLCHDLYYLKRRSILLDLLIILQTVGALVMPEPVQRPDERFIVAYRADEEIRAAVEAT